MVNFQSTESQLMSKGDADTKDESEETVPNPFSQLTDQELEEYKKEVERKKLEQEQEGKPGACLARVSHRCGICQPRENSDPREDFPAPSPNSTPASRM